MLCSHYQLIRTILQVLAAKNPKELYEITLPYPFLLAVNFMMLKTSFLSKIMYLRKSTAILSKFIFCSVGSRTCFSISDCYRYLLYRKQFFLP